MTLADESPKCQTVIIFDWDDTLLCSSWLREHDFLRQGGSANEELLASSEELLDASVQHARSALETATKAGHTYIITNAMSGWVESSAARWAPELLPVLRSVRIVSARDKFQAAFPDDARQWKIQAFLEVQRQLDATPITNLVALGDADYEIEAARIMGSEFEEGLVKTVKLQPRPDPVEHQQQLRLVAKNLEKIIDSKTNLKVVLERRK